MKVIKVDDCIRKIELDDETSLYVRYNTTCGYHGGNNLDYNIPIFEPLPYEMEHLDKSDFIPLKKLIGIKYEKIIGCYIIHNKEFDKYYVGQSKDVIKRVTRDHFSGTTVKNIIFAEDYYKSKYENKDDIFEVKIIRLETKDELDATEKALIEEYDSFNNGYNGTSGNK